MSCIGKIGHYLDGSVVGGLELLKFMTSELPKLRTSIVAVVDVVDPYFGLCLGMDKVKFLTDGVVLVDILGCLDLDVKLISINGVGDGVAEMLQLIHPWELVPTQQ